MALPAKPASVEGNEGNAPKSTDPLLQRILACDTADALAMTKTDSLPIALPAGFTVWGEPSQEEGWYEGTAKKGTAKKSLCPSSRLGAPPGLGTTKWCPHHENVGSRLLLNGGARGRCC